MNIANALAVALARAVADVTSNAEERERARQLHTRLLRGEPLAIAVAPLGSPAEKAATALGAPILPIRRPTHAMEARPCAPTQVATLRCRADGAWFVRADGGHVSLRRRATLRRLFRVLIEQRLAHPGRPISPGDLFAAVWPGERCTSASSANRVYVAMANIRSIGARSWLRRIGGGYLIDPEMAIEVEPGGHLLATGTK
jgi:hypothetical protein